ncbi:hypothetical protein KGM_215719 [Danaus plexippus plexippus]|uniref:Uncharacterized protein n=1 Tax=Danaus plexippus plexippus TaxID=278856 RepID=A0A212EKT1_DANPL|nr:hypothetical protein KGM_215719 [Danaus plexippus plexippus]
MYISFKEGKFAITPRTVSGVTAKAFQKLPGCGAGAGRIELNVPRAPAPTILHLAVDFNGCSCVSDRLKRFKMCNDNFECTLSDNNIDYAVTFAQHSNITRQGKRWRWPGGGKREPRACVPGIDRATPRSRRSLHRHIHLVKTFYHCI